SFTIPAKALSIKIGREGVLIVTQKCQASQVQVCQLKLTSFMNDKGPKTIEYCNGEDSSYSKVSYSLLRTKFDAFLIEQAEETV
ncbi:hypothetical protein ACQWKP_23345, partial [Salmonella enterica subsp. enterica serovar Infantis]